MAERSGTAAELTYAVAAPSARFGSLQAAYVEIHEMLRDALRGIGSQRIAGPAGRTLPGSMPEPASPSRWGEIMVGGRKVVGSAQFRQGSALLQHGSILLEDEQQVVLELTRGPGDERRRFRARHADPGRGSIGGGDRGRGDRAAAAARWPWRWTRVTEAGPVLRMATTHVPQFQSPAWTWVR